MLTRDGFSHTVFTSHSYLTTWEKLDFILHSLIHDVAAEGCLKFY